MDSGSRVDAEGQGRDGTARPGGIGVLPLTYSRLEAKMALWLGSVVLVLALVAWLGRGLFMIETTGAPLGDSVRVGDTIATLIQRLEPYVPSLHRDHGKDTYSTGLLLHTAGSVAKPEYVPIARGYQAGSLQLSKFLACDAERLRFRAPEAGAYDLRRRRLLTPEEQQRDTPPAPPRTDPRADLAKGDDALLLSLAAAGSVSATRWLGVLSDAEAKRDHASGKVASPLVRLDRSNEARALYVADLTEGDARARVATLQARGGEPMFNGGFLRTARNGSLLRLAEPPGLLLVFETQRYREGTVSLARLDDDGRELWRVDLGLGELQQVLPDRDRPAFLGTRPRVPGKVPEPVLVVVDARTRATTTWSLLWKD
ncbi:MAG: hypothetical protein IPM13_19225 [Phycisphaerales bacterium]|nr:hypothetical protein [Phycisphaerales bacterium]